jgi:hypothetical protein
MARQKFQSNSNLVCRLATKAGREASKMRLPLIVLAVAERLLNKQDILL